MCYLVRSKYVNNDLLPVLQKAGRNMEHTLIGAYVGLLLGYLIMDNKVNRLHCLFSLMMLNWSLFSVGF